MALTIATAGSGVAPAVAAEQPGSEGPAGSQTSDAFAGVLAGVGESGARPGRQDTSEDRPGARSRQAGPAAEADARAAADLAVLTLLAPAMPVPPIVAGHLGAATTAADDASQAGSAPVDAPAAGTLRGPAPQAADPARQAAARRPDQALAAQAAASAAKIARQDDPPAAPAAGQLPAPADGGSADRRDLIGAAGPGQLPAAAQAAHAATSPAGIDFAQAARANGSQQVELPTPATAGLSTATGALAQAFPPVQSGDSAPSPLPGTPPAKQPGPAGAALAAAGTLPGTAAAVAGTVGAVRATAGVHHRSAHGPAEPATTEPATTEPVPAAGGAPAVAAPIPAAGLDPAATIAPVGTSAVQPAPVGVTAGQPVSAGRDSQPVHQHPAADQPVASQVAAPVLALRARGDGSHQLIVALHPAELGPVNVHVRISGDAMTISLASTSETAHETLRDALPQLRAELQSAGLNSASLSLDLTSGGAGAFADPRQSDPRQPDPRQSGDPGRAANAGPAADQSPFPVRPRGSGARVGAPSSSGLDRWL